jgi:hypothetical protein
MVQLPSLRPGSQSRGFFLSSVFLNFYKIFVPVAFVLWDLCFYTEGVGAVFLYSVGYWDFLKFAVRL